MSLNPAKIKNIHEDIKAALKLVAEKHGLSLSEASRISYSANSFKFTAEFGETLTVGDATVDPKFARNAERFGTFQGLGRTVIGRSFQHPSLGEVTYVGMTSRNKAVVSTPVGKMYRLDAQRVADALKG